MTPIEACDLCLRRTYLVGKLSPRIEHGARGRAVLGALLALPDEELIAGLGARHDRSLHGALRRFDAAAAREEIGGAGLTAFCRHSSGYPAGLLDLEDAPAVLHVAGDAAALATLSKRDGGVPAIALVGARQATPYGLDVARVLGRGLAAAGLTIVSGMALGVDSAAHEGALVGEGRTVAVLAGGADTPYPATKRGLYRRILASGGCAVSELPPGESVRRWAFPARNRIIAALAAATVVVEARERSGSLITAEIAADLGRAVGAVPGLVTGSRSAGTNALLADGAAVVRGAEDALDLMAGSRAPLRPRPAAPPSPSRVPQPAPRARRDAKLSVAEPELRAVVDAVEDGARSPERVARALGLSVPEAGVALTRLELTGVLRREHDGGYAVRATG